MSRKQAADLVVKLIVGAGQASPSPPVGPALGSKGVKSMDFCKVRFHRQSKPRIRKCRNELGDADAHFQEFNARTAHYITGTPIPARIIVRPDRSFTFSLRPPPTATLLLTAAGAPLIKSKIRGAGNVPGPMNNHEGQKGKTSASSPTNGNAIMG